MSISAALALAKKYSNGGAVETHPPMRIKKHINFQGLQISIETPKGEIRRGIDHEGKPWANRMSDDYGYIKRTEGKDGDQVDVFVGPNKKSNKVFIIDQLHHHAEKFDEHKCLLGYNDRKQALTAYHKSYGRKYGAHHTVGAVTEMSIDAFKEWLKGGGGKKPISPEVPQYQEGGAVKYTEPTPEDPTRYPYYESEPGPGDAPPQPITPQPEQPPVMDVTGVGPVPTSVPETVKAIGAGLLEYGETPGELMKGPEQVEPRVEGQWDEIDEFRQRLAHAEWSKKATDFAAATGLNLFGTSAPFAQPGMLGVAGGKLFKEGQPKKYEFKADPFKEEMGKTKFDISPQAVAEEMKPISGSKGTSPGGVFEAPNGLRYYIKTTPSLDYAKNEVLTSRLYELAGVPAAKSQLTMLGDKPAVASKIIEGGQLSELGKWQYEHVSDLYDHFPADAWLANWDVAGAGFENPLGNIIIDPNMKAHRIDFGGGLRYSGLGAEKGAKFGPTVGELTTMRDPGINPSAASIFGDVPLLHDSETAHRIANIKDQQIWDLVNQYGPSSAAEKAKLGSTLIARRDDLAKQYGMLPSKQPHVVGGTDYEPPPADYNPNLVKEAEYLQMQADKSKPVKIMQLNKTHSLDQLIDSLKAYHQDEISPKSITEKQKGKIAQLFKNQSVSQLAEKLENLDKQEKANLKSWLPYETKFLLSNKEKIGAAPVSFDSLNPNHSVKQVVDLLKKKSLFDADITYSQAEKGKKILNKFPAEDIFNTIKDLPLEQSDKLKSWLDLPVKQKLSNLQYYAINKGQAKSLVDQFHEHLMKSKPFDFRTYRIPEDITDPEELMKHPTLTPQKRQEFIEKGFNPDVPIFHGGMHDYPKELRPPVEFKMHEPAFFAAHRFSNAWMYSGQVASAVKTFFARAPKTFEVNWPELTGQNYYSGSHMDKLIKAAHKHDADLLIVHNMDDMEGNAQTQYAFLKTEGLRAPHAKLAKEHLNKAWPLAGVAGASLYTFKGQEPNEPFARGGNVKSTKAESNYRLGTKKENCAICTMFRPPDSCTAVQGKIRPQDTCDYFELSKRKNPMPLKKGSSQSTISSNIREFHTGDTYARTKAKFGKAKADKQAIAVAMSTARKYGKKQKGGGVDMEKMLTIGASRGLQREGMISSSIPGRTDKLPMNVKAGSYVLPADIPSALGQGNTAAGGEILNNMFSSGPYGMKPMRGGRRPGYPSMRMARPRVRPFKQEGGEIEEPEAQPEEDSHVPIIAAGGEYIIDPEVVKDIGHGNIKAGHSVLDKFVLQVRKHHIDTLKKLKPPKK